MEYSEYLQNQPLGMKKHFISGDSGNDSDRDSENPEDVQEENQRISSLSRHSNPLAQDKFESSEEQNLTNDYEITNMTIKKEPGDFSYAGEVDLNYETAVVAIKKESETKEPSSDEQRTDDEYTETIPVKRQRDFEIENTAMPVVSGLMKYREGFDDQKISSESSSDDESGPESGFHAGSGEEDESDGETVSKAKKSDDSGSKVPLVNRIVKTKGELGLEDLPPIDDLQITVDENVYIYEIGSVSARVGLLVLVQAIEDAPALNVDSILFMENRQVLGKVFEVLGPVAKPLYTVRFNSVDDIEAKGIKEGTQVFYVPDKDEFTKFVFLAELKKMKGSDASWENNNEPPAKFLEYSDDESERRAKKGERGGGGGENGDIASKCAKRKKERSGKFNKVQDGQTNDGTVNNRNSNKRSRKPFQSWPPQPGDFSESADFPAPAPPQEFPSDYPGFQIQQSRPFQPDNSVHFQGPNPHSESRGFHGPPPRNPCFRPGVQGTQSFRPSCPVNGDFRCPSNHGDPRFANQLPPRCNGPPITDQAQPNFARPPGPPHRFGGRPQFNASRFPCQQNLSQPHQHPRGNNMGNNYHMNQNRPAYQWGNTNEHPPQFFDQPQDARPRGPSQRPFRPPQGPPGPCQRPLVPPQRPNEPSHRPFGHPRRPFDNCPQSHAYPVLSSNIPSPLPPQQSGTYSSFQDMANTSRPPGQDYNGSGQAPNQPVTGSAPPRPQIVDQRYIQRQT